MAEYRITTPDGKVFVVKGPDGASEEQLIDFARQELAKAEPGNAYGRPVYGGVVDREPAKPGLIDPDRGIGGSAANALAAVGEGVSFVPDAILDGIGGVDGLLTQGVGTALAAGADLVGLDGTADWLRGARDEATERNLAAASPFSRAIEALVQKPDDPGLQLQRAAGQGLGGAMSGLGTARFLVDNAPRVGASAVRSVGEMLGVMPNAQAVSGITSGIAAEGARQMGAPIPVQLATGIAAGGATPSAMWAAGGATDAVVDRLSQPGVLREAAKYIRGNLARPEHEVLASLDAAGATRSGALPTLAEVSRDPGLAAMQRGVGNLSGPAGARISNRVNSNAQTRLRAIDETLGPGDVASLARAAVARERSLASQTAQAVDEVGPMLPPDEAGAAARATLTEGYQAARGRTADAYGAPILQENPPIALRPLERTDIEMPTIGDTRDIRNFQDQAVRGLRSALPYRPRTLLEYVRARGGVSSDGMGADDLRSAGMGSKEQPTFINRNGVDADKLREGAVEAGYINEDTSLSEFLELLQSEYVGAPPRYAMSDLGDVQDYDEALNARNFWRREFGERELDPAKMTQDQWVDFYNDVEGAGTSQGRTMDDLERIPSEGRLMGPFQQTVLALRNRYFGDGGAEAPAVVRNFIDDVLNADEVGLKTLEGWERRAMDLAGNAPDRTTAASLQAISKAIGARASMAGGPDRRAALDAARGVRREQGEVFEAGAVGRTLQRGDFGRFNLPDSDVGRVLVPRGRSGGAVSDQVQRAAGDKAEDIARAEVRRALDDAGTDPRQIARVARDYREAVSRFPDLNRAVRNARSSAALAGRFRSTQLGQFVDGSTDPAQAVSKLLTVRDGGRAMRTLLTGPGMTAPALAGVRRGIAEHIRRSSLSSNVDADLRPVPITRKMVEGVVEVLQRTRNTSALAPAQRSMLNAVRKELMADQFARSANRPSGSDTARNVGMAFKLFEGAMNVVPDTGGVRNVTQFLFRHLSRTDDIIAVVTQAIEDPKFAAELLRKPTDDRIGRVLEGVRAYNQAAALGAGASAE